jgi:hypothetical protein
MWKIFQLLLLFTGLALNDHFRGGGKPPFLTKTVFGVEPLLLVCLL